MFVKEFRVILPLTVEEYQVAQLYSVAEASKNETGGGEGIEVLKNEPFENYPLLGDEYNKGQYTYKIYHLKSKVPAFIRLLAPEGSLEMHEEAWNAYPYCRTIISNPGYMKENFYITIESLHVLDNGESENNPSYMKRNFTVMIETLHLADMGTQENAHRLTGEKLNMREVVTIDIANDPVKPADYKADEDPTKFKSEKTGRGPLQGPQWWKKIRVHGAGMMESDGEGVVTLVVSDLEEIEGYGYADTSEEEVILDDLAVNEVISDDDSATLTASSESDSSDNETSQSVGASSANWRVGVTAK
ncbi:phosphatidylinositol transfer protein beta isoform-like isoform X3 [Scylla paramamosain]|uniref:phosphatidylinositol transfer protein beta isoform-like isoform X3 n=1 Tax=Scylla paramamosain TaxID=85552 RepID=UPI00308380BE